MKFRRMKLKNFRQFKNEITINFSTDENKNVTVILGNNGAGKTTILQAFNWCLYGQVQLENPNELINKDALSEVEIGRIATVEVEIELEHLNKVYRVRKYIDYIRNAEGNIRKYEEDQIFTITDSSTGETRKTNQNAIREIFPSDLSIYFLFDGERMQNIADNARPGKKDLSNAVRNLMGLDVLDLSKTHLKKVASEFESEYVTDNSSRLEEINLIIKDTNNKIEEEKNKKNEYENELEVLEKDISKINEILKNSVVLKELQEKREQYSKRLIFLDSKIEQKKKDIFTIFGKGSPRFLFGSTLVDLRNKLSKTNLKDKGIEGINGPAIDQILKSGKCICGCDLSKNPDAISHLRQLQQYLPPHSYATLLKGLEVAMNHVEDNNESFYNNFNRMYDEYYKLLYERDNLLNESKENDKTIADIGDQDLSKFNNEYLRLRDSIASKNQAIGSCKSTIENYEQTIRNRESERSNIAVNNDVNAWIDLKVDICKKLIEDIDNRLKKKEKQVKDELQEKTTLLLSRMLNSNKSIEIDDDYSFNISDEYKTTTLSEGEKIVTAFAFVGSIISVAKDIVDKEDDSKFTLVMDAPFAKLDMTHRKNVTEEIPRLTDQIILLSADSQWDNVVQSALNSKIGKMYEIKKIRSGISTIEEGDFNA